MATARGILNYGYPAVVNENVMITDTWLEFVVAGEGVEYAQPGPYLMEELLTRFNNFKRRLLMVMQNQDALNLILDRGSQHDFSGPVSTACPEAASAFPDHRSEAP